MMRSLSQIAETQDKKTHLYCVRLTLCDFLLMVVLAIVRVLQRKAAHCSAVKIHYQ